MKHCIGLFGTCGSSKWREKFINRYKTKSISYFNPQKDNWKPEDAVIESEHLLSDDIVLFPITSETFGTASLAETGYSIINAIKSNENRYVIIFIDKKLNPLLHLENPTAAKESTNSRTIVLEHLKKLNNKNIFVVDSLETMLELSIKLYKVYETMMKIRKDYDTIKT